MIVKLVPSLLEKVSVVTRALTSSWPKNFQLKVALLFAAPGTLSVPHCHPKSLPDTG